MLEIFFLDSHSIQRKKNLKGDEGKQIASFRVFPLQAIPQVGILKFIV